jgi:hypothetical protein
MDRILYDTANPAQVISRRQDSSAIVWGASSAVHWQTGICCCCCCCCCCCRRRRRCCCCCCLSLRRIQATTFLYSGASWIRPMTSALTASRLHVENCDTFNRYNMCPDDGACNDMCDACAPPSCCCPRAIALIPPRWVLQIAGQDSCPSSCNNKGKCILAKCVCDERFWGPSCDLLQCPQRQETIASPLRVCHNVFL